MKTETKSEEKKIEETKKAEGNYVPTDDEDIILQRVYHRYDRMRNADSRVEYEEDIDLADKEYNAYIAPLDEDDYRSNINKPISFAIIETIMQETIERKPRPKTKPRSYSDETSALFTNDVLNFSMDVGNFDFQYVLAKKEALKRGTGFLFEYYRYDKRNVGELKLEKKDGEVEESYTLKEKIDYDDVYAEYEPGEHLYFDPAGNHITKCRDMVKREVQNIDEFYRIYNGKRGFINVDKVKGGGTVDWPTYYTPPEGLEEDAIEILHYYNRSLDRYDVVANGVLIRKGYNPHPHHELPVIPIYCYKDPNRFYGLGIPKIIKSLVDERNTNSNLRMDTSKMGISKMFFIDDMIELDDMDLITRPHGIIPVNTNGRAINQVVQEINPTNIPLSSYKEEEIIVEDIRRTTGVDDRVTGVNMGGTATEASILKEATMKRINAQNIWNEMDALVRFGELRLENIKFFYSIPKFEKITGKDDIKEKYREISVNGKQYKMDENGSLVMEEKEGTYSFTLDDKMMTFLELDYDITAEVDSSYVVSKPVYQSKVTEMVDRITSNPLLMNEIDGKKLGKLLSKVNDIDPRAWMKETMEKEDMMFLAQQENDVITAGYPIPPTKGATEDHTSVHINYAQSAEFAQVDEVIQQILESHIKGEGAAMGIGQPSPDMNSQLPNPNVNPVDIMPNSPQRQE